MGPINSGKHVITLALLMIMVLYIGAVFVESRTTRTSQELVIVYWKNDIPKVMSLDKCPKL